MFRERRVENETEFFGRQAGHNGLSGREGERGVDYFRYLLREIDEEFGFRGIEGKIVRRHPRRDESDSGLMVDYGRVADEKFLGIMNMKSCISSEYRR